MGQQVETVVTSFHADVANPDIWLIGVESGEGRFTATHYVPLHSSPMGKKLGWKDRLPVTEMASECLLRLPVYPDMTEAEQFYVIQAVRDFLENAAPQTSREPH